MGSCVRENPLKKRYFRPSIAVNACQVCQLQWAHSDSDVLSLAQIPDARFLQFTSMIELALARN